MIVIPFYFGLLFAFAEHMVRSIIEHTFRFRPHQILYGMVRDGPSVCAFAFLAGLGADWLKSSVNHAPEAFISTLIWGATLIYRQVIEGELWWLKSLIINGRKRLWRFSIMVMGGVAAGLALTPYLIWWRQTSIDVEILIWASALLYLFYLVIIFWYTFSMPGSRRREGKQVILELVSFYSKKSPNGGSGISQNPSLHQNLEASHYINRFYVAYHERNASQQCVCREDDLVERIEELVFLSRSDIREMVKREIQEVADVCELEFWTLVYIVSAPGSDFVKAKDILKKSKIKGELPKIDSMRSILVEKGSLLQIPSSI